MSLTDFIEKVSIEQIQNWLSFVEVVIKEGRREDSDFIRSSHTLSCPKCGSHPVNHLKGLKTVCRKCGASFERTTVRLRPKNFYKGKRVLYL